MPKRDTKSEIIEGFAARVERSSLSQVRIAELIESLGINRNTFYYHFSSKYDVAMYVFRIDLDHYLREAANERLLVCSAPLEKAQKGQLCAYYVHDEIGARTLDASVFMRCFIECLLARRNFYNKLFTEQEPEFLSCIRRLYFPAFQDDIDFILSGRYMPEETLHLLAGSCTSLLVSTGIMCLQMKDGARLLDERANPFLNIVHESLFQAIQSHPINRYGNR